MQLCGFQLFWTTVLFTWLLVLLIQFLVSFMWCTWFSLVFFFFMLSGRDSHCLWGRPSELWVRQNRTGPLLLQNPAGQGPVPLDGLTTSFFCISRQGQMDALQKDCKPSKWLYCMVEYIFSVLNNNSDHLKLPQVNISDEQMLELVCILNLEPFQEFPMSSQ